jgi:biotin-(acetyl-CoA carboxylase) ligase
VGNPDTFLIGVGVNCNRVRFPPDLEATATSLAIATGNEVDRGALLVAIAERLHTMLEDLAARRRDRLEELFRERLGLLGQRVQVESAQMDEGRLTALDFERLELDGDRRVALGIVKAIRRAPVPETPGA